MEQCSTPGRNLTVAVVKFVAGGILARWAMRLNPVVTGVAVATLTFGLECWKIGEMQMRPRERQMVLVDQLHPYRYRYASVLRGLQALVIISCFGQMAHCFKIRHPLWVDYVIRGNPIDFETYYRASNESISWGLLAFSNAAFPAFTALAYAKTVGKKQGSGNNLQGFMGLKRLTPYWK